jgi:TPR repeat protein
MELKKLTFLLALTFLFLFSGSVYGDDLQEGLDAYKNKDYETALKLFLPLADDGNTRAQYTLGVMYEGGQGVPQDYKETIKWWKLAAEQEYAVAQVHLGLNYSIGRGVPQDIVLAHMWCNLASSNGDELGTTIRNLLVKEMTPSQIEKAQEMARNWKPKK